MEFEYEKHSYGILLDVTHHMCGDCLSKKVQRKSVYTPDFKLLRSGVVVEVKGKMDARARKIALAMKEQHSDVDLRFLFQRDNKLSKSSKTHYSDWCKKNEIKYAVGEQVPKGWV